MIFYEEILKEFRRQRVEYIIVGGVAMNLLGAMRNTADLDVLVALSDQNLAKVVGIMKKQGYRIKQPVDPAGIVHAEIRREWIKGKGLKALNFFKEDEFKEVDLIIDSPVSFEEAKRKVVHIRCGKTALPVISIDQLIKMKKKAGRPVDRMDVEDLRQIQKLGAKHGF